MLLQELQLYSRIGFAHQYQPLDPDDIPTVLAQHWQQLGMPFDPDNTDHAETANAVTQITGGNFRLIERLMTQIARVMAINQLTPIFAWRIWGDRRERSGVRSVVHQRI